jgi:hypothetical protein
LSAVAVPALLITKAFVVWTFVAVMIKFPVTDKFDTDRYSILAFPGTYKFARVAKLPVTFSSLAKTVERLDVP